MATIATTSRPGYIYDSETDAWIPIGVGPHSHENYVDKIIVDSKGELLVGIAPDTVGIVDLGFDGQYLRVNSATSTGVEWSELADPIPTTFLLGGM
jgi:hypothetical protein